LALRDQIFSDAIVETNEARWIGGGLGSFAGPFGEEYPHNLFLNYAVDGGLILAAVTTGLLLWLLLRACRATSLHGKVAFSCGIFFLVNSLLAGYHYEARLMWIFLILALLDSVARRSNQFVSDATEGVRKMSGTLVETRKYGQ
jgi:O-antigen ligase